MRPATAEDGAATAAESLGGASLDSWVTPELLRALGTEAAEPPSDPWRGLHPTAKAKAAPSDLVWSSLKT